MSWLCSYCTVIVVAIVVVVENMCCVDCRCHRCALPKITICQTSIASVEHFKPELGKTQGWKWRCGEEVLGSLNTEEQVTSLQSPYPQHQQIGMMGNSISFLHTFRALFDLRASGKCRETLPSNTHTHFSIWILAIQIS